MRWISLLVGIVLFLILILIRLIDGPQVDNLIKKIEYADVSDGQSTIDQVVHANFSTRIPGPLNENASMTRWLKLTMRPVSPDASIVIRIANKLVHELELYQHTPTGWQAKKSGIDVPVLSRYPGSSAFSFLIKPDQTNEQTYYLKVFSPLIWYLSIDALSAERDALITLQTNAIRGFALAIMLFFLLIAAGHFFESKDYLFFYFGLFQLGAISVVLANSNFFLLFNISPWLEVNVFLYSNALRLLMPLLLSGVLVNRFEPPRWYKITFKILMIVCLIALLQLREENGVITLIFIYSLYFPMMIAQLFAIRACTTIPPEPRKIMFDVYATFFLFQGFFFLYLMTDVSTFVNSQTSMLIAMQCVIGYSFYFLIHWRRRQETAKNVLLQLNLEQSRNIQKAEQLLLKERTLLVDIIGHQIKNPLATIKMASEFLLRRTAQSSEFTKDRLIKITNATDEINNVLEHCILSNAVDNHSIQPSSSLIDVESLIEDLAIFKEHRSRITLELSQGLNTISDSNYLGIVFNNLISNALKYGDVDQNIRIYQPDRNTSQSDSNFTVSIANFIGEHGAPSRDHLYERYYRGELSKETFGMGLGLHICQAVCQILKVNIDLQIKNRQVVFSLTFEFSVSE